MINPRRGKWGLVVMDTSYCQEIDAQFGREARVASKQGKEKVKVRIIEKGKLGKGK